MYRGEKMKLLSKKKDTTEGLVTVVDNRSTGQKVADFFINNALYLMIIILVVYCAIRYPLFLKNAPVDLLKRTAAYVIMALGVGGLIVLTVLTFQPVVAWVSPLSSPLPCFRRQPLQPRFSRAWSPGPSSWSSL
jgi:hypothetical protein